MIAESVFRRAWLLAVLGLVLAAAVLLALGEWRKAGVAVVALMVTVLFSPWWVSALTAVGAGFLELWVVSGLLAVAGLSKAAWTLLTIRKREKPDHALLAAAVDRIDPRLGIERAGSALATTDLLAAAAQHGDRQDVWTGCSSRRGGFDGPLLDPTPVSGPATLFAGEACKLAELAAETFDIALTLDLYAASAVLVVDSAAQHVAGPNEFSKVTGAHPDQVLHLLTAFASAHGGGDMTRRLARHYHRRWLGPLA